MVPVWSGTKKSSSKTRVFVRFFGKVKNARKRSFFRPLSASLPARVWTRARACVCAHAHACARVRGSARACERVCASSSDISSLELRRQSTEASRLRRRQITVCVRERPNQRVNQEGREERMPSSVVEGKSERGSVPKLESSRPKHSQNSGFHSPQKARARTQFVVGRAKSTEYKSNHLSCTSFVCFWGGIRPTYLIILNYEYTYMYSVIPLQSTIS